MKHNAWAALTTVFMILAPGAVLADASTGSVRVLDYDSSTSVLTGIKASSILEQLRSVPGTSYKLVDCPDLIVDLTCRSIANSWNVGRLQNQPSEYFGKLLGQLATSGCSVEYTRNDVADDEGTFEMISVRPTR